MKASSEKSAGGTALYKLQEYLNYAQAEEYLEYAKTDEMVLQEQV